MLDMFGGFGNRACAGWLCVFANVQIPLGPGRALCHIMSRSSRGSWEKKWKVGRYSSCFGSGSSFCRRYKLSFEVSIALKRRETT